MAKEKATVTTSERIDRLQKNAAARVTQHLTTIMNQASADVRDYIKRTYMGGGSTQDRRLARNTGNMEKNTVAMRVSASQQQVTGGVHINVPYASTHFTDSGRTQLTITPRNARFLTVPILLGANKRPPKPLRAYTNTSKDGNIVYTEEGGVRVKIFRLKRAVVVKTRINIQRDIQPFAEARVKELIEKEATRLVV